ncbi:hypothetical protein ACKKBG_A35225 [Auxenochlorella protothecoides x Auxenochlorella symbiontica]
MSSARTIVLLILAVALPACLAMPRFIKDDLSVQGIQTQPDFCGDSECPPFKLVKETDNYEVRTYDEEKWVITNVTDSFYTVAYPKATTRLLKYFKGQNDKGTHLNITTPTVSYLELDDDRKGTKKAYTFGWFISRHIEEIPKPTDPELEIVTYPETTRYVRVFGGYASEGNIVEQAVALQDVLSKEGKSFEPKGLLAAVYDAPQKLLNRHNEVHLFATGNDALVSA